MPQIFQVLRCYKCSVFQVHQTRKDNKWICKICGEKQSVKRHYGLGTGKDCRLHVQKLNKLRRVKDEASENIVNSEDSECDENIDINTTNKVWDTKTPKNVCTESKWSAYIDKIEQNFETSEPVYLNNKELVLEAPLKRKMHRKCPQFPYSRKVVNNEENCIVNMDKPVEIHSIGLSAKNVYNSNLDNFDSEMQEICHASKVRPQIGTNVISKNKKPHLVPEKVNKSKWAQFIDNEGLDNNGDKNTEKNCYREPLFSLCDDNEIDTILDL